MLPSEIHPLHSGSEGNAPICEYVDVAHGRVYCGGIVFEKAVDPIFLANVGPDSVLRYSLAYYTSEVRGHTLFCIGFPLGLLLLSFILTGLMLAINELDPLQLQIVLRSGSRKEQTQAAMILPLVKRHHLVLVTLMLANAMVSAQLPLFLTDLFGDAVALLLSVASLFLFGQMLPQALCARRALPFASSLCWLVWPLVLLMLPAAWLPARILEAAVGKEPHVYYKRRELDALVQAHADAADSSKVAPGGSGRQLAPASAAVAISAAAEGGQGGSIVAGAGSSLDGHSVGGRSWRKLLPAVAEAGMASSNSSMAIVGAGASNGSGKVIAEEGDGDDVSLMGHSFDPSSELGPEGEEEGEGDAEAGFREGGDVAGGAVRAPRRGKFSRKWSFIRRFLSFRAAYEGTLAWTPELLALALPGGSAVVVPRDLSQMGPGGLGVDGQGLSGPGGDAGCTGEAVLTKVEASIIRGVLDMHNKHVRDVYTPLASVFALPMNGHVTPECMRLVRESGVSRVPVYLGTPENVVGVILAKSFIGVNPDDKRPIASMNIRQVPFVSAGLLLQDALSVFRVGRSHLAVVLNERDRVSVLGVVTLEDVLEALLGFEIVDETDEGEEPPLRDEGGRGQLLGNEGGEGVLISAGVAEGLDSLKGEACAQVGSQGGVSSGGVISAAGGIHCGAHMAPDGVGLATVSRHIGVNSGSRDAAGMSQGGVETGDRPAAAGGGGGGDGAGGGDWACVGRHDAEVSSHVSSGGNNLATGSHAPAGAQVVSPSRVGSGYHFGGGVGGPVGGATVSMSPTGARPRRSSLTAVVTHTASPTGSPRRHPSQPSSPLSAGSTPLINLPGLDRSAPSHLTPGHARRVGLLGDISDPTDPSVAKNPAGIETTITAAGVERAGCATAIGGPTRADASSAALSPSSSKRRSFSDVERADMEWADASRGRLDAFFLDRRQDSKAGGHTALSPALLRSSSLGPSQGAPGSPLAGGAEAPALSPGASTASPRAPSSLQGVPSGSNSGDVGGGQAPGGAGAPHVTAADGGGFGPGASQGSKRRKPAVREGGQEAPGEKKVVATTG